MVFVVCFYFETGSLWVAQAGSELMILLPNSNIVCMPHQTEPRGQDFVRVLVFLTFSPPFIISPSPPL